MQRLLDRVEAAAAGERDPWARLEKAVAAHLDSILDASAYARVLIRILPTDAPEIAAELKELRDRYEARLDRYFSAITLPRERDATIARLALLGAMNWTPVWYKEGGKSVPAIARELLAPLRALAGVKPSRRPQMTREQAYRRRRASWSPRSGSTATIAAAASSRLICAMPAWK